MNLKKVSKNIFATLLTQILNFATHFILPPLLVKEYGSVINGLVVTVRQLMSYVSLVGAGISIASVQSLYKPIAEKDYKTISGMFNAAAKMFNRAGSIFSVIILVLSFIYPYFVSKEIDYWLVVKIVLITSIAGASEFFVVGKCTVLLFAAQRGYVTSLVQASGLLGSLILSYLLIKLHYSIVWVQFAASFVYVFRMVILAAYVRRHYTFLNRNDPPIMSVVKQRNNALIHQLTGLGALGSQTVILSLFVSLQAASIYAVYNIVFAGLQSIFAQLVNSLTPFIGQTIAQGDQQRLQKEFLIVELLYSSVMGLIIAVASLLLSPFITLYMKGADIVYANPTLSVLFVLFACCNLLRLPAQMLINGAGHFKETRWQAIIEASSCVFLQLLLVQFFNIVGVLFASILALGWRCLDIVFYADRKILHRQHSYSFRYILKISFIVISVSIYTMIFPLREIETYLELFCSLLHYAIVAFCFSVLFDLLFYKKEIKIVSKRLLFWLS